MRTRSRVLAVAMLVPGLLTGGYVKATVNGQAHALPISLVTACEGWTSAVDGTPDLASVPAIGSVELSALKGGLLLSLRFSRRVPLAPEGVYFAWDVYLFHKRSDASPPQHSVMLQIEDRGKGWQPTGWSLLVWVDNQASQLSGDIGTDKGHDELQAYFPTRDIKLQMPFYWYASQEALRAYLPEGKQQDWAVNGTVAAFCPPGVQADLYSLPVPAKLLES